MKQYPYQSLIGSPMYLAVSTRPDIAYRVGMLSQFNKNYGAQHWKAAKRVLRYLKGTADSSLIFQRTGIPLTGFADANWGACIQDRRSYTGYIFKMAGAAVSWESRKQRTVALSSTEYLPTTEMVADILTKSLHGPKHTFFMGSMGVADNRVTETLRGGVGDSSFISSPYT
ncbi:hypothetical protein JTB14_018025 [Gonioctena quinquepunctata]|nr:hypothetical protein JTB14_018025 [Gonioctena quinquepunctata]